MLKVYRLLRNNQETGPYLLEELLQLQLKPADLIWVEGKSGCWSYPHEIESLRPHVPPPAMPERSPEASPVMRGAERTPQLPPHVFVSMPAPRSPVPHGRLPEPQHVAAPALPADSLPRTHYARSLDEAEEAYTDWVYRQKVVKRGGVKRLVPAVVLGALLLAAGYFGYSYVQQRSTTVVAAPQQAAQPVAATQWQEVADTTPTGVSTEVFPADLTPVATQDVAKPIRKQPAPVTAKPAGASLPEAQQSVTQTEASPTPVEESPAAAEKDAPTAVVPVAEEKKRGFLGGLFRKKDREQEAAAGAAEEGNRKARRRETAGSAANADLAGQIELSSNAPKDDWMLGVVGRKLTLHNHSRSVVKNATVEVSYLSEDNEVLERKTILFTNIGPKGNATVALPDHKMASRTSFKVLAASGASE